MTDALCGPSNPLQSFQKHSSVDRTLQQDRLLQRNPQREGFRSDPGPSAGILDAEFHAFQAGVSSGAIQPQATRFLQEQHAPPVSQRFAQAGPSSSAGWASDFSRLHIGTPPPQVLQRQPSPAQMQSSQHGMTTWFNDFQRTHTPPQFQTQPQWAAPSFQSSFPYATQTVADPFQQSRLPMDYADTQQAHMAVDETVSTEAWSQAFNDIGEQLLREEKGKQAATELMDEDLQFLNSDDATDAINAFHEPTVRFNPDVAVEEIQREPEEEQDQQPFSEDELAMTAGELLDRVADNKTEKFQQSSFLSLMRKLRDYEVKVEGDKMVDVEVSSPEPTTYPNRRLLKHLHLTPADPITCKVFGCDHGTEYDG